MAAVGRHLWRSVYPTPCSGRERIFVKLCIHTDCFVVSIEVLPENLKQPPVVAESVASEWSSTIGLRSPRGWTRLRMAVAPEGPKQPPAVADSMASEWTSTIGLRSPHGWTRFRMALAPEGLKQLPVGTESVASELYCPLRQLWDHLVQLDRTWQLCRAGQTLWLFHVVWIALGRWRNVKRPQGQGGGQTASTSVGTGRLGKRTVSSYELLCLMEVKIALLVRSLRRTHRLRLKELRRQYSSKVAREEANREFSSEWQPAEGSWAEGTSADCSLSC
ncbi:uncharacterized protein LOC142035436 isoform X1 [Buteo buteo]|uniref:uncharacterized protein LOC142035433 isoform X1 n=1 Tax=Buteo buteo TaxID=30397 RepID=UPI003EBB6D5D